jgi:hypothetical protein
MKLRDRKNRRFSPSPCSEVDFIRISIVACIFRFLGADLPTCLTMIEQVNSSLGGSQPTGELHKAPKFE